MSVYRLKKTTKSQIFHLKNVHMNSKYCKIEDYKGQKKDAKSFQKKSKKATYKE